MIMMFKDCQVQDRLSKLPGWKILCSFVDDVDGDDADVVVYDGDHY